MAGEKWIVSLDEIGPQLHALAGFYGLHLRVQQGGRVEQLLQDAVPGLAGWTNLCYSSTTRNQYWNSMMSLRTGCSSDVSLRLREVR